VLSGHNAYWMWGGGCASDQTALVVDALGWRVRDHRDAQIPPQVGLLYLILDSLIDSFFPVLSELDDDIDDLESAILKNPTEEQLGTLFDMKRRVLATRRVVAPQRDMIESSPLDRRARAAVL
jgi:CorA-like Mg2+ transporter protein